MPSKFCAILAVFASWPSADAQSSVPVRESLAASQQMVVVTASDWKATAGWLRRFERSDQGLANQRPAVSCRPGQGRTRLGAGMSIRFPNPARKRPRAMAEAPPGFSGFLTRSGTPPPDSVREIKLPYVQCTASLECVDDTNSVALQRHPGPAAGGARPIGKARKKCA